MFSLLKSAAPSPDYLSMSALLSKSLSTTNGGIVELMVKINWKTSVTLLSFITFMEILNLSKGFSADMFQKTSRSSLSHHQSGYQEELILASYCSLHWLVSWWQKFLHSFGSLSLDNIYLLPGAEQSLLKNNSDMCDTADECHNFTLLHLNSWMLKCLNKMPFSHSHTF